MTFVSIIILISYTVLHIFSVVQTDRCIMSLLSKKGSFIKARAVWIIIYVFICSLPVFGTFWPDTPLKYKIMQIGNLTLGFDIYYCGFLVLFTVIVSVICRIRNRNLRKPVRSFAFVVLSVILAVIFPVYGMIHAQQPIASYWEADITDGDQPKGTYRIVLLGDFHMSVNSNPELYRKMVDLVNEQDADVIFITGDFFTSNYEGLKNPEAYIEVLKELTAKEGVIGTYGNHDVKEELFCGFAIAPVSKAFRQPEMVEFLNACGFRMLEDEVIGIAGGDLLLAGRLDADKAGDGTSNRMLADELLSGISKDTKVLVLEHEPVEYKGLEAAGADMAFSGHTHNGQIWPCNIFVKFMTKNAYGYKKVKGLHTFVTSGVGYFGPPIRSGTNSEVMVIDLTY